MRPTALGLLALVALVLAAATPAASARPAPLGVQDDPLTSGPVASVPARLRLLERSGTKVTPRRRPLVADRATAR